MPARAAWKGYLRVNQLSVPVKAFTAVATGPEIPLNQLHRHCGQRVRQKKVCPVHGEIEADEIISGFEYAQEQYLPLEPADLQALRPEDLKAIDVDCFVPQSQIDPVYHSGRTYYLVPDGPPGQRPFCVLREGMRRQDRHAVALVVIGGNELLVILRPLTKVVAMTVLEYPQRIRHASDYETEVSGITASDTEQNLIGKLIDSMTDPDLDLERFRDGYTERLDQLIRDRLAVRELPTVAASQEAEDESELVVALMASLAAPSTDERRVRPSRYDRPSSPLTGSTAGVERKLG